MNIWEIDQAIMACVNEDGEVVDIDKMNALQMERSQKVENIGCWIKNLRADAKAIREEKKRLEERADSCDKKADSLQKYLESVLDGQNFSTSKLTVSYRKSKSVDIINADLVPERFLKTETKISKQDIKNAIVNGEEVPGCVMIEKENIQIK